MLIALRGIIVHRKVSKDIMQNHTRNSATKVLQQQRAAALLYDTASIISHSPQIRALCTMLHALQITFD